MNELFEQLISQMQDAARAWEHCGEPEKAQELLRFVDNMIAQTADRADIRTVAPAPSVNNEQQELIGLQQPPATVNAKYT